MSEKRLQVRIDVRSADLRKTLEGLVTAGGLGIQPPGSPMPPDLLILELGARREEGFEAVSDLVRTGAAGEIFVASREIAPEVLLRAMRAGVKELLSIPPNEAEVREALDALRSRRRESAAGNPGKQGRIFFLIGSKGGVGTTMLAVNLAVGLASLEESAAVGLVDVEPVFGNVPLHLGIKPAYDWREIAKNASRVDAIFLTNILSHHASGVHILPSPPHLNGRGIPPEAMEHLLGVMRRTFDFVVLDGGQALDGAALKGIEISDAVLIVTRLDLPCLSSANRLLSSLTRQGILSPERTRLIVNRYTKNAEITPEEAEESVGVPIFWKIPEDGRTVTGAINEGKPLREIHAKSPAVQSVEAIARTLSGKAEPKKKSGLFWRK